MLFLIASYLRLFEYCLQAGSIATPPQTYAAHRGSPAQSTPTGEAPHREESHGGDGLGDQQERRKYGGVRQRYVIPTGLHVFEWVLSTQSRPPLEPTMRQPSGSEEAASSRASIRRT
ncbi:hypothetical protein SAY86_010461 [Trapa natans]|uniref:Uncharacterized protein n=1 Tax=Trapa natans TaxID=22666 RepID=A0AAN7LEP3_TRANT|nr:hypothetical protein SAY86_010461 [Trapa natans]